MHNKQENINIRELLPSIGPIPIVIPRLQIFLDLLRDPLFSKGLSVFCIIERLRTSAQSVQIL